MCVKDCKKKRDANTASERGPSVLVPFDQPVREVCFLRREKRFLVLVEDGREQFWVHTNNTGSMLGLLRPGRRLLISKSPNAKRKYSWTLEAVHVEAAWCCVDTSVPNKALYAAFHRGVLPELAAATGLQREAKIGDSRLDAHFTGPQGDIWVEAKNVTLVEDEVAGFPDAVTIRGQKHLRELIDLAGRGVRVAGFYLVSLAGAKCFAPADYIDPAYARLFYQALEAGVEAWPYTTVVTPQGVSLGHRLEVNAG
jgi:sugar fermentation stimulation protein A